MHSWINIGFAEQIEPISKLIEKTSIIKIIKEIKPPTIGRKKGYLKHRITSIAPQSNKCANKEITHIIFIKNKSLEIWTYTQKKKGPGEGEGKGWGGGEEEEGGRGGGGKGQGGEEEENDGEVWGAESQASDQDQGGWGK